MRYVLKFHCVKDEGASIILDFEFRGSDFSTGRIYELFWPEFCPLANEGPLVARIDVLIDVYNEGEFEKLKTMDYSHTAMSIDVLKSYERVLAAVKAYCFELVQ